MQSSAAVRVAGVAAGLLACALAHAPLAGMGFTAPDLRALVDVESLGSARGALDFLRRAHAVGGLEGEPLAALQLALSAKLWSGAGGWAARSALPLRLENLALLLGAAVALGFFLRRLLLPWMGREVAGAAGWTAALLLPLAPVQTASIVHISMRGELLALLLGTLAGTLLLRGRQERRPALSLWAGALVLCAAASSDMALALPLILAAAEFVSARRWRPERERWRTALVTLFAFGLCVALPVLVESAVWGRFVPLTGGSRLGALGAPGGWTAELARELERVGVLVLPVHTDVLGVAGIALAAAALLIALHPALQSARAAPRLWGWLAAAWFGALVLAELLAPAAHVTHSDLTRAHTLLAAATVTAAGLAVAATALSGWRRLVVPAVLALCWVVLAHGGARAWRSAGAELAVLSADMESARQTHGRDARLIVLAPPGLVRGVDALQGELGALCDPAVTGRASDPRPARVRSASVAAFLMLTRQEEFDELRAEPWVVSMPRSAIGAAHEGRIALRLSAPSPSGRTRSWPLYGSSPALDLEALHEHALRVRTPPDVDTARAPVVHWRAQAGHELLNEGSCAGVWSTRAQDTEQSVAMFDLSSSLAWALAGRVQKIYPREGWGRIDVAEVLPRLPEPAPDVAPRAERGDWHFKAPPGGFPSDLEERDTWSVQLFDLASWRHVEIDALREPNGDLHFPGCARLVAAWLRAGPGPVAWSLEGRVAGVSVWRASGRRVAVEDR